MFRTSIPLTLFFSLTLGASAQSGGGSSQGTFATTPPESAGLLGHGTPSSFVLSGKVSVDDGTPLTDSAALQSNCKGRIRTEGFTDSKGNFSLEISSLNAAAGSDPAIDFSQMGRRRDPLAAASAQMQLSPDLLNSWSDCELQAVLPGFTSQTIDMARHLPNAGFTDVGTIALHRLAQVQGFTISVTSARAPAKAKKEYERGREFEKKEKWDPALGSFRKAVGLYPEYAVAWFEMGRVQAQEGNVAAARQSLHSSLSADSKFISPYQELAQLGLRDKQWEEVVENTDALLNLDPISFPQAWFLNAAGNFYLRHLDVAERSARHGLEIDGQHRVPKLEYLLGTILAQKHDYAGALEHLRNYLRLAPHAADIQSAQKQAEEIERLWARTTVGK